jgi:hypothetical protein
MKLKYLYLTLLCALFLTSCGNGNGHKPDLKNGHSNEELRLKGDKTIYGLACEGCNDSVVVILPSTGGDPVKYDIIDAHRLKQIMGKLNVGDWIGVVVNPKDKRVADKVIDLDELKGIWCYIVMPKMRDYEKMSKRLQARIMKDMPDSIKATYMIPREYGFWLKRQWAAQSIGNIREQNSLESESPVVYPKLGFFKEWHIWNGKLIVVTGEPKLGKNNTLEITNQWNDTCNIDYLGDDSLVLTDSYGSRSYYRKKDIKDVNVKAKAIAERLKAEALKETKQSN